VAGITRPWRVNISIPREPLGANSLLSAFRRRVADQTPLNMQRCLQALSDGHGCFEAEKQGRKKTTFAMKKLWLRIIRSGFGANSAAVTKTYCPAVIKKTTSNLEQPTEVGGNA